MLDEGPVELIASRFIPHKCVQKELSVSNDGLVQCTEVSMWGSTYRYESCCVRLRHDTSHGSNGNIRLIGTQILEMLQRDCGIWRLKRFQQILKNLYKSKIWLRLQKQQP